jgi:hypothetical protein
MLGFPFLAFVTIAQVDFAPLRLTQVHDQEEQNRLGLQFGGLGGAPRGTSEEVPQKGPAPTCAHPS